MFQIPCHGLCLNTFKNENKENNAKCVVDIFRHYLPRNGKIFISFASFQQTSQNLTMSSTRVPRSIQNQSNTCTSTSYLPEHTTIPSKHNLGWKNYLEEAVRMECIYTPPARNTTLNDMINYVIENIHTLTSWNVIVDDQISHCNYDYLEFDGFIFILDARDEGAIYVHSDIMTNLFLHKARVIIIILGRARNLENVFRFLTHYSLKKSIIIHQDEGEQLYIIHRSHDYCGNFKEMFSIGYCNKSKYIKIKDENHMDLKIYKKCQLLLLGENNPPFSVVKEYNMNLTDGIELKLLSIIASHLNFELQNNDFSNYKITDRIHVGRVPQIHGHTYTVQYMERYYTERYTWIVPRAESHPQWSSLTRVFKSEICICVLISLSLVSLVLRYLDCKKNNDISLCFVNLWGMFLNVALKEKPSLFSIRIIFISWILTSVAFTMVFQALVSSFFIEPGTQHQINTIEELEESNLILAVTSSQFYLTNILHKSTKPTFLLFFNDCAMLNFCFYNKNVAALTTKEIFLYNSHYNLKNAPTSSFHMFTEAGVNFHRTFNFHMGNPFIPLVNKVTIQLVEAGIVNRIIDNFSDPSGWTQGVRMSKPLSDYVPLSLFHMLSPFVYLIFGLFLSILAFVVEVFMKKLYYRNNE